MRRILCICLLLCLLLCACAAEPKPTQDSRPDQPETSTQMPSATETSAAPTTETSADTTEEPTTETPTTEAPTTQAPTTEAQTQPPVTMAENSAYVYDSDASVLGVIVNEPFSQEPTATIRWREGEYDRAYIIPRHIGSYVNLYGAYWDDDAGLTHSDKAVKSAYVDDGCVIYGALERPEGITAWYVEIVAPDGSQSGFYLHYNGNTGTPPLEYFISGSFGE